MKRLFCALCSLALVSIPALTQPEAAGKAPMTDQQFVNFAGQTDMVEANLGQLAQETAASQDVKNYGEMLATDHTNDYKQLQDIAGKANLTVPTAIDAANNKTAIGPFHKLKGAAFDRKYIPEMVSGHTQVLALYKKEAQDAESPAIRSYAEAAIPVLQKHLDGARDLAKMKTR